MEELQRQQLRKLAGIILRRRNLIVTCLLISVVAGIGVYLKTPKVYQSTALIIYQRQRVNPTEMSPDVVNAQTREMVSTLSQQVTSRSSLEGIVKQFELYKREREKMPMEDVVDLMRERIAITPSKGDVFNVSYEGSDPKKVMLVTNALSSRFIEENLRFREEKATETTVYVKDELAMAKENLDKKEEVMRDYKLKYYNEMPQQLQVNMSRLNALQDQYQKNQEGVRDLEKTRILVQEQIGIRRQMLAEAEALARQGKVDAVAVARASKRINPAEEAALRRQEELRLMEAALTELKLKYTEQHPEVRRLSRKVEVARQEMEGGSSGSEAGAQTSEGETAEKEKKGINLGLIDPQLNQLELQLKEIGVNIAQMREAEHRISSQIKQYQAWIDATPVREAEWAALTRDYEQLSKHYQELVSRGIAAESAQNLERRQKGSQFKIVDSAHFPEKPFRPDFAKIMLLSLALGLGVGAGLGFLLEITDSSLKTVEEAETFLGVPVVCAIPLILDEHQKRARKIKNLVWLAVFAVTATGILGGVAILWKKGLIII